MRTHAYQFAFVALSLWLLGNLMGAHGHFCFDGQEPPVSVHMHWEGHGAHDHHPDEVHQDADIALGKLLVAKLGKTDSGLFLLAALTFTLLTWRTFQPLSVYCFVCPRPAFYWRPSLRAPPFTA